MKKGWEITKLDDIIESNVIGLTKNSSEQNIHHQFKYVKMNNITKDNCFDLSKYTCVNAEKSDIEKYRLSNDDFLFNTRNSYELVGKTCLFKGFDNEVILYNNNIMRIRFLKSINPYFINYAFSTDDVINKLDRIKSGTTNVSAIYYKDLRNLELLIPSLQEQQRIVDILDEAFAAIAQAKANAEQNLKNAKELFESYLQSVFENKGEGWEEKTLNEIVDDRCTLSYGIVQPGEEYLNGLPVIRPTDLTSKFISLKGLKLINPKLADSYKRTTLMGNELLLCVRGNTGVISIATDALKGANVTRGLVPICFNPKILKLDFGYYQFISAFIMKQIKGKTYGAALMQINIGDLRKISMLIPSLPEQQIIVQKLDALSAETKQLEAIYQQKINDLDELKKSILQKAFAGELNTAVDIA